MASDVFGLVGTTIDRRYRVDEAIGEGGFGVVYRGFHLAFKHPIAVKCLKLPGHFTSEAQALFVEKFREEGAFLSRLSEHGSIVRVFDLDVTTAANGSSVPYLVLEWLEGRELEGQLEERRMQGAKPHSEVEAVEHLRSAVDAIALAHTLKIAHRDLKPANLFEARTSGGTVLKVLDFGIAKAMQEGETATQISTRTSSGFSAFSPQYGAPEQFRAKRYGATGPWTDVHALGLILTELVSGKRALEGEEHADFFECATAEKRPTPRARGAIVSDEFEALCSKALALDPRARFQNAGELGRALDALVRRQGGATPDAQPAPIDASTEGEAPPAARTQFAQPLDTEQPVTVAGGAGRGSHESREAAPSLDRKSRPKPLWMAVPLLTLAAGGTWYFVSSRAAPEGARDQAPSVSSVSARSSDPDVPKATSAARTESATPAPVASAPSSATSQSASASAPVAPSAGSAAAAKELPCGRRLCVCDDHARTNVVERGPQYEAGSSPVWHACGSSKDCARGSVCVDEGFCKPACAADSDCSRHPYANLKCQPVR